MSKLKPCPFCGKEVFLLDVATRSSANAKWDVYCRTHGCFLNSGTNNMFSNREEAVIAWNTRVESVELTTLREQVKVLRESKKQMLDEIRVRLGKIWWIHSPTGKLVGYDKQQFDKILDEMEAKL